MSHVSWDLHRWTDALTDTNAVELSILPSSPGPGKPAVCPGRNLARDVPHDGGQGQQKALRIHDGEGPRTAVQPSHCTVAVVVFLSSVVECWCSVSVGVLRDTRAEDSRVLRDGMPSCNGDEKPPLQRGIFDRSAPPMALDGGMEYSVLSPIPILCVTLRCMYDACTFARLLSIAIGQERLVDFCPTLGETVNYYVACTR